MLELYDGKLSLRNDKGKLSIMVNGDERIPVAIMHLHRNTDAILGFLKLMKSKENTPKTTIRFIRTALFDCRTYNNQKFTKRNPKEILPEPELIDMTEFVQEYLDSLDESENLLELVPEVVPDNPIE